MEQYFSQLYEICRWGHFDVLGHLTYPLRYIEGEAGIPVPLEPYAEQIRCCFRALEENGKGIELNSVLLISVVLLSSMRNTSSLL